MLFLRFTPAFVACGTNAGEDLVRLSHVQWRTWTCEGVAYPRKNRKCATDRKHGP